MERPEFELEGETPAPPTEPAGALAPPIRRPPTAVGTGTPGEPPPPPRARRGWPSREPPLPAFGRAVRAAVEALDEALERLDPLADGVARALGLRPRDPEGKARDPSSPSGE